MTPELFVKTYYPDALKEQKRSGFHYIYKITNPLNQIYIGQSKKIQRRFLDYSKARCISQKLLYNSIIDYGWQNHKFEILFIVEENKVDDLEIDTILKHKAYHYDNKEIGLNMLKGGRNAYLMKDKNVAENNSLSRIGKKHSKERCENMSKSLKGYPAWNKGLTKETNENVRKYSEKLKNKKISPEELKRLSNMFKGRKHTENSKLKMSISLKKLERKKIIVIYPCGKKVIFNSRKEACDLLNLDLSTVCKTIDNKITSTKVKGYSFEYVNN
jgi:group I intron endonuclease